MDLKTTALNGWELIASGEGRKLERFGPHLIERPSPQSIWRETGANRYGEAVAVFNRKKDGTGDWIQNKRLPAAWRADLFDMAFEVRLTGFGNVGIFPEHAVHWQWMRDLLVPIPDLDVLNLFAYTGGASIACAKAGARVTHVDAAKSVNGWASVNAKLSGVENGAIRFLADDAVKFVKREMRRGRRYHGVILDPPTFGRGAKGEVWKIERDLMELIEGIESLLGKDSRFVLLTAHSPGVTPAVLRAILSGLGGNIQSGEMLLKGNGLALPAGAYVRWTP